MWHLGRCRSWRRKLESLQTRLGRLGMSWRRLEGPNPQPEPQCSQHSREAPRISASSKIVFPIYSLSIILSILSRRAFNVEDCVWVRRRRRPKFSDVYDTATKKFLYTDYFERRKIEREIQRKPWFLQRIHAVRTRRCLNLTTLHSPTF